MGTVVGENDGAGDGAKVGGSEIVGTSRGAGVGIDVGARVGGSVGMGVTWAVSMHYFFLAKWRDKLIRLRSEAGALRPIAIADAHQCPSCLSEEFKSYTPKNWIMRHWVWNPGLAINEVVLGQRIPKLMRTCDACGGQSCPCPHCAQSIDLMTWSRGQAFGHWGGLHCPHCHGDPPCHLGSCPWG